MTKSEMTMDAKITQVNNDAALCKGCQEGKMVQQLYRSSQEGRKYKLFELLHYDICGPMEALSIGGSKYLLLMVDEATGCMKGYCLKLKLESEKCILDYIDKVKTQFGAKVNAVRHNDAKEFATNSIKAFLSSKGIYRPAGYGTLRAPDQRDCRTRHTKHRDHRSLYPAPSGLGQVILS